MFVVRSSHLCLQKAGGQNLGRFAQNIATLLCALVIAFVQGSPLLSGMICIIFPFIVIGFALQMRVLQISAKRAQEEMSVVGGLVSQAVNNIRTVVSFQLQNTMVKMVEDRLSTPMKEGFKRGMMTGFSLGFAQFIMFGSYALVFWYGGKLVYNGDITFNQLMKSLMVLMLAAQGLGENISMMGDQAGAKAAIVRLYQILNRRESIFSPVGAIFGLGSKRGSEIKLDSVCFSYPSRKEVQVLKSLDLTIPAGSVTALVGRSGSGKSTVISLLERFYDPDSGRVMMDGVDVRNLDLKVLRDYIAHVGQEPVLMPRSILDNIKYGRPHATLDEVIEAAKMANAHDFIMSLPEKYQTNVGALGSQLSGGQKQRIAIARAILKKDAKIVLLDEATSALDRASESLVQQALDQLMHSSTSNNSNDSRTCIVIAHRLSTLRNADHIIVMNDGVVIEQGSHNYLTEELPHGLYAKLIKDQFRG
jgi:ATP-binding cassette subfamily B (MDR/TAP) protein 1